MAIPKRLLTRAALKRHRAAGMDADTLAWFEKQIVKEEARKRRLLGKKKRSARKAVMGMILATSPTTTRHPNAAEEKPRGFIDPLTTRDGVSAKQSRPNRRSPRTGLAKFGLSL
jgi:hypothetical protein